MKYGLFRITYSSKYQTICLHMRKHHQKNFSSNPVNLRLYSSEYLPLYSSFFLSLNFLVKIYKKLIFTIWTETKIFYCQHSSKVFNHWSNRIIPYDTVWFVSHFTFIFNCYWSLLNDHSDSHSVNNAYRI